MDGAGRLVVPKALREQVGLTPGSPIEVTERGGELVLRPVGPVVRLETRAGRKVFVTEPVDEGDTLSDDDVRRLVEESRQWPRD